MPDIPTPEESEWLLDRLAELIRARGHEPFVSAPIIEGSPRWFPDPWKSDPAGVQVVARRLLWHAGLVDHRARVTDIRDRDAVLGEELTDTLVGFAGLSDDKVEFELSSVGSDDIIGILSHEVGRVYRTVYALDKTGGHPFRDPWQPEEHQDNHLIDVLSSITAVYLGLAVPATNASHSARHAGTVSGRVHTLAWSHTMAGGLPPQAMSYLCAVQAIVRDDEPAFRALLPNQASVFRAWCHELRGNRSQLLDRLGLPSPAAWGALTTRDATPVAFEDEHYDASSALIHEENPRFNTGLPVFRLPMPRTFHYGLRGFIAGIALAFPVGFVAGPLGAFGALGMAVTAGVIMGAKVLDYRCCDTACGAILSPDDDTCPGCDGMVVGQIAHMNERLDALEAWEERNASTATDG